MQYDEKKNEPILMVKKKLFIVTTVPMSFIFFKGQLLILKDYFDITLISSPEEELKTVAHFNDVKSYGISMKREISLFNDFISLLKLIIYFFRKKPDVIHCNTPKGSLLSLTAGWLCGVPIRIYYLHGLRFQGTTGFKRKLLIFMEKLSCHFATEIIAVSHGIRQVMVEQRISAKKIDIIWNGSANGIDLSFFDPLNPTIKNIRPEYDIKSNDFVFGFVGRLVGDKGINELVEAFCEINSNDSNTKLLLVGKYETDLDPLKSKTLEQIQKHPNIIFAGAQTNVNSFYAAMDIFVFPSYREGFGVVLMEAAAMNLPSICSDIIGCNEIVEDNKTGFLIPSKDKNALAAKMQYCLTNKSAIEKMSRITRVLIKSKFEQKVFWEMTVEKYKKISF